MPRSAATSVMLWLPRSSTCIPTPRSAILRVSFLSRNPPTNACVLCLCHHECQHVHGDAPLRGACTTIREELS